ncbi:MAG: AAA family ATPase [Bacillota bacterium]
MKDVFITATGQDVGKTAFTLGLISLLRENIGDVGYIKPIGQRYVVTDGAMVDEDVHLIDAVFDFGDDLKDMSPIIIERGFTRTHMDMHDSEELARQVIEAHGRIAANHPSVILEGAGSTSVGESFGLSNMRIAQMIGAPVIIVAEGGIGRTVDECMLHMAYLQRFDVRVLGVIINKVYREKMSEILDVTVPGLEQRGLPVLGVIPYEPLLLTPTLHLLMEELDVECLTMVDREVPDRNISRVVIGAMKPHHALDYIRRGELLITGGDREDILIAVLCRSAMSLHDRSRFAMSGIIVTGGIRPHESILRVAEKLGILILFTEADTYKIVTDIKGLTVKIRPEDREKLGSLLPLMRDNIDLDRIMNCD